jgi:hypothetical protein
VSQHCYREQSPFAPAHEWRFENAINQDGVKDQGGFTGKEGERVDKEVVHPRRQSASGTVNRH